LRAVRVGPSASIFFAEQPVDDLSCGFADDVTCTPVALRHRRRHTPSSPVNLACATHEGGHFFVADLDEFGVAGPLRRADHAVDAIARITIYAPNSPSVQPFHDKSATFIS
jgi:hypothetical protein